MNEIPNTLFYSHFFTHFTPVDFNDENRGQDFSTVIQKPILMEYAIYLGKL